MLGCCGGEAGGERGETSWGQGGIQIPVWEDKWPVLVNKLKGNRVLAVVVAEKIEQMWCSQAQKTTQLWKKIPDFQLCLQCWGLRALNGPGAPQLTARIWAGVSAGISVLVPAPWWPQDAAARWLSLPMHSLWAPPKPGPCTPALWRRRKEQLVHPTAEATRGPPVTSLLPDWLWRWKVHKKK